MAKNKNEIVAKAVVEELEPLGYSSSVRVRGRPAGATRGVLKYGLPENLLERFLSFAEDEDWLSLADEIAVLRTMLSSSLEEWSSWQEVARAIAQEGKEPPKPPVSLAQLSNLIDNVGKMVERQHRMLYSANNLVTLEAAATLALSVGAIVNKFVKDPEEKSAVFDALRTLLTAGSGFQVDLGVVRRLMGPVGIPIEGESEVVERSE